MNSNRTLPTADDSAVDLAPSTVEPPPNLLAAFRQIGPGLILAAAIVGTGELIATTNLGARAGFALLWLVVLSCFIKVFVQIELGRNAIVSNRSTFSTFARLPGPGMALVWWCTFMLLITQLQIGAMIGGLGQAFHMVLPGFSDGVARTVGVADRPELPWGVLVTLLTAGLLATGSYRLVERFMTILVVGFTTMTVVCVTFLPPGTAIHPSDVVTGLSFHVPPGMVAAALAMFGITGVGANELLSYPYWCLEKGYARHAGPSDPSPEWARRARGWLQVMKLDAWVSMVVYTVATVAFYLLGAAILHERTAGEGLPGTVAELLEVLSQMYEPVLGATLSRWFLVLGAFAVLYSTLFAATAGTARLLSDFMRVNRFIDPESEAARLRWVRVFCVALPLLGLILFIAFENPVKMVLIGGIAQAITLPLIATAAVFLRYKRSDARLRPGPIWDGFLILSMLGLTFAGLYSLWQTGLGAYLMKLAGFDA